MAKTIGLLIAEKGQELALTLVPKIVNLASQAGIKYIGTLKEELPNSCQLKEELDKILKIRNQIVDQLNSTSKKIEILSKTLNSLTPALDTAKTGLNIAKTVVKTAEVALIALPPTIPIPFPVLNTYIKTNKLINITLPPIITQTSNKITSITKSIDFVNNLLLQLINLLKSIDSYLIGCDIGNNELTPLNNYLQNLENTKNTILPQNIYNGFILEIVEEPFSPTVNRRKAVAKNNNGIILLSTPLSFTTDNQTLLNQIKLLIDSNDLKAD